jgi:type II secretion system protein D
MIIPRSRTHPSALIAGTFLLITVLLGAQQPPMPSTEPATGPAQAPASQSKETISIQFPHTSVSEVLTVYEKLTGKRIIRDSNLAGPELSIMVTDPIPQNEAVSLIESSLLLNGYTLVPVDAKTVKILGPSRPPRSEGLPLYLEESQLPQDGDKLVSFYKPLRFLAPSEAVSILQGVVQLNAYGSLVAVPNTGAIVITDKTPVIRKAIALLDVVDHEPTQIITEFIPLQRANAEKVVETLSAMFGGTGGGSTAGSAPPQGGQGQSAAVVSGGGESHLLSGKAQFIADKRTNRVLVVVKADNYKYIRELIAKLDQPIENDSPLIRPLNYLSVGDLFPVLVDMLRGKDDATKDASSIGGAKSQPTPQNQTSGSSQGNGGASSGGVSNTPDKLADVAAQNPPQSATIGSASVIADSSGNAMIVYGPPEAKAKAAQIINLLDQRPKQVYLAAVIGQLRLSETDDYGASWIAKIQTSGTNNLFINALNPVANGFTNVLASGTNVLGLLPGALGGLSVYGTVANGVMTYAQALETSGKFRILSRPCVYTSNNKKATIFSGQNVPIPGQTTYNGNFGGGSNAFPSQTSSIQYQPVVLKLEVIPLINSDKEVNLVIAQRNDKVGTYNNVGGVSVPTIETQELTTTVRVPSGSTIVLGGLITEDKASDDAGIPYINRIPIVGALLGGHTNKAKIRRELVVMIQPIVVDSNDAMEKASLEEGGDSNLGQRARTFKEKLRPTPTPTPKKKKFSLFGLPKIDNF